MVSKLKKVINPLATSTELVGAEFTNQLVDLFNSVSVDVDEPNLAINTVIRWWNNKFALWDSNQTHLYKFSTEDISDDQHKTILWRDIKTNTTDSPVYEKEFQIITNKILGISGVAGTQLGEDINALGKTVNNLGKMMMYDAGDRNVTILKKSGTSPNTIFDLLGDYNTAAFAALSSATDIRVRFGYNSKINLFEFWSSNTGTNLKLLSITKTLTEFNSDFIDFKDKIINNLQLSGLKLLDSVSEPVSNTTLDHFYRKDIDVNNHRGYISKLENGIAVKIRVY